MSALFQPYTLKDITLRNRIAVPPMCQYMAVDGQANDWHLSHYAGMARGGAGLVIVEATAVAPEGRITPGCTGIWNDDLAQAFVPVVKAIKAAGSVPGIQIAHAGRKASANRPWEGDDHILDGDTRGWQTIAPSAIAFGGSLAKVPRAMDLDDIARVQQNFVDAAIRAREVGFEWLELHFAHGYLAQSFFSSHANQRDDIYGGSVENRSRFLLETLKAVRAVWPEHLPLTIRFGVLEFDGRDEQTLLESIGLVRQMNADLAGRSVETEGPPLSERLKRILAPASRADIVKEIDRHGLPALETVRAALETEEPDAEIGTDEAAAWLTLRHGERTFVYRIGARSRPRPTMTARETSQGRRLLEWRLMAQTGDGARPHDITGFTHDQIVADVLEQLQRWRLA